MTYLMPDGREVGARRRRAEGFGIRLMFVHSADHPNCLEIAKRHPVSQAVYTGFIRPSRWRKVARSEGMTKFVSSEGWGL